jgi:hypothetical protein
MNEIKSLKDSLVRSIAHQIAHAKLADENFNVHNYLDQVRNLFEVFEMPKRWINQVIRLGHIRGLMEYSHLDKGGVMAQAIKEAAAGAQIDPAYSPIATIAEDLVDLFYTV